MSRPSEWFLTREIDRGVFLVQEPGHVQSFLVCGRERAALIDTGMGFADIRGAVRSATALPVTVLNTHWHFDHIGGNASFTEIGISRQEAGLLTRRLSSSLLKTLYVDTCLESGMDLPAGFDPDAYVISSPPAVFFPVHGDEVDLGGRKLQVLATPGHTRGSLSFLDSLTRILFCGDLVYDGTLYAHLADSDLASYQSSLAHLAGMATVIGRICPGHNDPMLRPDVLDAALAAVTAVAEGRTRTADENGWSVPVLRHEFNGVELLTPAPGGPGADLLAPGRHRN